MWCLGTLDALFLARMEQMLALYALPYAPASPVVCFDARPCFLIGETLTPIPMQLGKARKHHYPDEKLGSCALLAAIAPLTGRRLGQGHAQRTKCEYTLCCPALAAQYPDAITIRLVQDNLNTHNASACDEHLPAAAASALAQRFEFIYTPQSASWLHMIECECAVIPRLCLNRRIPTIELLRTEVLTLLEERRRKQIKIAWQFSVQAARTKLNTHYTRVQPQNEKYNPLC